MLMRLSIQVRGQGTGACFPRLLLSRAPNALVLPVKRLAQRQLLATIRLIPELTFPGMSLVSQRFARFHVSNNAARIKGKERP